MRENMLGIILGSIIILQNMDIFAKFVKFFIVITHARLVEEEEHPNPKRRFQRHEKSSIHLKAVLRRDNAHMEESLSSAELLSHQEKQQTNELYVTKLIKIVNFLARNNLPVKEMYPKMIRFLSDKMEEPVLRQYLESSAKNAAHESSVSCDSFLVSLNFYLKNATCQRIVSANDIALSADAATSAARKGMIGVFIGYFDEVSKSFILDFISLLSVSSTKSEILIEKVKEIMTNCGIDITKTRFVCFDRANSMSGEKSGVQRRYRNDVPFSIYVNCRCHRLLYTKLLIGFKISTTILGEECLNLG